MYIALFMLLALPLCSGLFIYFIPTLSRQAQKLLLVFGGGYLFSFMLVHMLPELFAGATTSYQTLGVSLLVGFFLQIFLDFLSEGIAHSHVDISQHSRSLRLTKAINLVIALWPHALLDGLLLGISVPNPTHAHHSQGLLLGILLHEIPISLTLTIMLKRIVSSPKIVFIHLLLFSLASPIGWLLAHSLQTHDLFSLKALLIIRAVAMGNLLHIATSILSEASPEHHFNAQKFCVIVASGIMAVIMIFV